MEHVLNRWDVFCSSGWFFQRNGPGTRSCQHRPWVQWCFDTRRGDCVCGTWLQQTDPSAWGKGWRNGVVMPGKKRTLSPCVCGMDPTLDRIIPFLSLSFCSLGLVITGYCIMTVSQPKAFLFCHSAMHPSHSSSFDKGEKETNQHIDESNWAQIVPSLYLDSLTCQESQCHYRNHIVGGFSVYYTDCFQCIYETII